MRRPSLMVFSSIALGLAGCQGESALNVPNSAPVTLTLHIGSGALLADTPWTVIFDSVLADSRCPIGAMCIAQGEARLALELSSPLADPLPQDKPHFQLGIAPIAVEGLHFSQVAVTPLPRIGDPIDPSTYVVTLRISRSPAARP